MPHRTLRVIKASAFAIFLASAPAPGLPTEQAAPLPDGFAASGRPKVPGLYAESRQGRTEVNAEVARLETACADRGIAATIQGRDLKWSGKRQIYRSHDRVAVVESYPTIVSDAPSCTARISLAREVRIMPASKDNLRTAGWQDELPVCKPGSYLRCMNRVVAGVAAQCISMGDSFVGSTDCFSTQADLSRGLRLASSDYSDDGSLPDNAWQFDIVMTDALIDPAVFDSEPRPPPRHPGDSDSGAPAP